ncbi:hypothetical protein ES703_46760 [subsurface metagenome]
MQTTSEPTVHKWAIPGELKVPPDPLRLRLDFHHQAVVMTFFEGETVESRIVSAADISKSLASDLSFGTGLLPPGTIWWLNTKGGPVFALYVEPQVRKLALQEEAGEPPHRFTIPLPGFIFLCSPGRAPWVYAVKKKPTREKDIVYKAPLCNIFASGQTCPGNHRYPTRVADIVQSFFVSFFTTTADLRDRSKSFPNNIVELWSYLDKKKKFPLIDLVQHGTVKDLMEMELRQ